MFLPPGFGEKCVMTTLGRVVYYAPVGKPWSNLTIEASSNCADGSAQGNGTLVFLHAFGGGSSAYEWSKVYPAFAVDYHIIAPDLIGWGRSDHPARNYRIEDYIRNIIEFVEKTCNLPITAISSGLTAAFTICAAIERPDLFKSLILTTPAGLAEFGQDYSRSMAAQVVKVPVFDRLLYLSGVASGFGIRSFLEQRQFARASRVYPEIVQAYQQSAQQFNAEYAALAFVRGDLAFDLSQYITGLSVPTAIIWGQKSEYTGPDVGGRLAEMNPQAVRIFCHLEDVGLTPQLELPGVTIGLIRKFLPLLESKQSESATVNGAGTISISV
ncbi:alpha/beta fold hydrolase [Umezakia ovalisporum]|uniref:Alpha/beta hydrolase n=1 Tax=Umezakia ovalisporum FSS-43 TaxID=2740520 RepID=A0ABT6K314_9CYAN|nr:alpha/beta hydrolase [Umezakia ovalisporum]MDH6056681.1 alpha/beta hydrolase [Umezakia ovalisporum FSS-43]MDH6070137.1 alpha/beta hydrolase [Umezakia ovalisporum CobakiLakeA]MDH6079866.1 alpha/beta hydrolase [Umezakia ovalisporum FSS-44]MDH6094241.1 alpha/beta hydrolase [Umezakia ovalisporum CobakiLakeB]